MDEETFLAGRPELPYLPGFEIIIRSHTPHPPFGHSKHFGNHPAEYLTAGRQQILHTGTRMEIVMLSPPAEVPEKPGSPPSTSGLVSSSAMRMKIIKTLAVGLDHRAQVVVCEAQSDSDGKSFTAVAKIYDPLYYSYWEERPGRYGPGEPADIDTSYTADSEYSREAAAYERFRRCRNIEGILTPTYHGSWTFSLPVYHHKMPQVKERQIRMIMMDYINGTTFNSLRKAPTEDMETDATFWNEKTESYRMEVWARVIEAEAHLYHTGVNHNDRHPRNVMILPKLDEHHMSPPKGVRIIDWGLSEIWKKADGEPRSPYWIHHNRELPDNPALGGWNAGVADYADWLPSWYFDDDKKRHDWLIARFMGDKAKQFAPIHQVLTPGGEVDWTLESRV